MSDDQQEVVPAEAKGQDSAPDIPQQPDISNNEEKPADEVKPEEETTGTKDDNKNELVSEIGEIPPPYAVAGRRKSNLTVENVKRHEQREEKSRQGSGSAVQTASQQSVPRTASPLAPLKGQRTGSGGKTRNESAQRVDGVVSPVPSGESLRTGSGKPLPPIGIDKDGDEGRLESSSDPGQRTSMPRILGYKRERSHDYDSETVESGRSLKTDNQNKPERLAGRSSNTTTIRNIPSPANREIMKTVNADGSEKVMVSMATETEWSWLESARLVGKLDDKDVLTDETKTAPTARRRHHDTSMSTVSRVSGMNAMESGTDSADDFLPESDDKTDADAESEYSDEDLGPLPAGTMIPQIGPPNIIRYQRESEKATSMPLDPKHRTNKKQSSLTHDIDIPEEDEEYSPNVDSNGRLAAPTGRRTRKKGKGSRASRKADSQSGTSRASSPGSDTTQEILPVGSCEFCSKDIKPFPTPEMQQSMTSEEISVVSMMTDMCEFCHDELLPFPTVEMAHTIDPIELYCCEEYQKLVEFTIANTDAEEGAEELIDIAPHAPYGSKQARRAAKERAAARLRERAMARQRAAGANQANFFAFARQMKTINYSLSSQRCMDEGWTLRAPTPSDDGNEEPDPYEAQPVYQPPLMALAHAQTKQKHRPDESNIVSKKYSNGNYFMVMFDDGTGTIFYQSGQPAIVITSPDKGQYQYIIQEDVSKDNMLALFEPSGKATCYQSNGQIKLNLTPHGGIYLDQKGAVKKRWLWKDKILHTHAPPFQPICFALNKALSLRCMGQDQTFLQFNQEKQSIRFNVGVKLKLVKPENLPKDEVDNHLLYLSEVQAYFKLVTDKIHNSMKFSKSPKLSNMRPPYTLQKDLIRNERLKSKKVSQQVQQVDKGTPIVTVN